MKIVKITFDDGTENEFKEIPLEKFKKQISFRPEYHFYNQHKEWEQDVLLSNLNTDLEDWAKDQYDPIDKSKQKDINDFSNMELKRELENRGDSLPQIEKENIINEGFIERIIEISKRGDDNHIDSVLETLEKLYRIK